MMERFKLNDQCYFAIRVRLLHELLDRRYQRGEFRRRHLEDSFSNIPDGYSHFLKARIFK